MVQIEDRRENSCSVLIIILKRHGLQDVDQEIYSHYEYSTVSQSCTAIGRYHDSLESVLVMYSSSTKHLYLEGIGMPQYTVDMLSSFSIVYSISISSITVPSNQSYTFFSNSTVRQLSLSLVHDIDDLGEMPLLTTISIKNCTLNRMPNLSRSKYPNLTMVEIMDSIILNESWIKVQLLVLYYRMQGLIISISDCISI